MEPVASQCRVCGVGSDARELFRCSQCFQVVYCSRACQVRDWDRGGHKAPCLEVAAHRAALAARPSVADLVRATVPLSLLQLAPRGVAAGGGVIPRWDDNPRAAQRVLELGATHRRLPWSQTTLAGSDLWLMPLRDAGHQFAAQPHWLRFEARRQAVVHDDPALHADFFFLTVALPVPADRRQAVAGISASLVQWPQGAEVAAGCHFLGAALVTLWLAARVATGQLGGAEARSLYGPSIMRAADEQAALDAAIGADGVWSHALDHRHRLAPFTEDIERALGALLTLASRNVAA